MLRFCFEVVVNKHGGRIRDTLLLLCVHFPVVLFRVTRDVYVSCMPNFCHGVK